MRDFKTRQLHRQVGAARVAAKLGYPAVAARRLASARQYAEASGLTAQFNSIAWEI